MFLRKAFLAALAGLAMTACADQRAISELPRGATMGAADPVKQEVHPDYRLSPADLVQVEVYNVPSLNATVQLDSSGEITLPLIGKVQAKDKTSGELSDLIEARYGEKYLQNPQVSVLVKQARQQTITVDGAVTAPGIFPVQERTSLIRAIAQARGLDPLANPKQVVVFREINNQRVAGVFDLTEIRSGQAVDPPIYPNDTIVVATSGSRRALRDIIGAVPLVGILTLVP